MSILKISGIDIEIEDEEVHYKTIVHAATDNSLRLLSEELDRVANLRELQSDERLLREIIRSEIQIRQQKNQ